MSAARRKAPDGGTAGMGNTHAETTICSWCSATVPIDAATCPSCGAALRDAVDGDVLGVTQIDPSAVARIRRVKPRRLTAWLTGDVDVDSEAGGKVEPPSDDVRREMLRLELAAIDAEIAAKVQQVEAQRGLPPEDGETAAAAATATDAARDADGASADVDANPEDAEADRA